MKTMNQRLTKLALAACAIALTTGCSDANVALRKLSKAADNFEVNRRIVFYNRITDTYLLSIEGICSKATMTQAPS